MRARAVAAAVGLTLVVACGGDDEPASTTTTTASTTTTSSSAPRAEPPAEIAAVTVDGRLVVIDSRSGEELRELARLGDPTAPPPEEGPPDNAIDSVAVSPDGETVLFSVCCEPAGGSIHRVPMAGGEPAAYLGFGYEPTFATSSDRYASVEPPGLVVTSTAGEVEWRWDDDGWNGEYQEVAWSLDGETLVTRVGHPDGGELVVVPFGVDDGEGARTLPGDTWSSPAFRQDGRLTVGDGLGGTLVRVLDVDSGDVVETLDLGGAVSSLDYDPTGSWLVAALETADGIVWMAPGGDTTVLPGRYYAAAW